MALDHKARLITPTADGPDSHLAALEGSALGTARPACGPERHSMAERAPDARVLGQREYLLRNRDGAIGGLTQLHDLLNLSRHVRSKRLEPTVMERV